MPNQHDHDAMTEAWTFAVLNAAEAADDETRLEIARILCPAGFMIVPTESMELPKEEKNEGHKASNRRRRISGDG
jgi:hypothetical protein